MSTSNFQHGRDTVQIYTNSFSRKRKLPQTVELLSGKPHFVLFHSSTQKTKTYVDMSLLMSQAMDIFKFGAEKPLIAKNGLQKLKYGLNCLKKNEERHKIEEVTRKEITSFWEHHVLTTAKWLIYFDSFDVLEMDFKIDILKAVWHVWGRLDKMVATALYRNNNKNAKYIFGESGFELDEQIFDRAAELLPRRYAWFGSSPSHR
ncbi:hypothetical protein L3Y34_007138 [Caenorhabditis briggsae]|uniref:NR LBD domain-containing protein n=1 Tax=Caenorhabditis briggsae TaxID=6238 RepID=A0AAE9A118_CAEBR|nr:hypothetical protein L3Y34_007138 [Caenorhabditis briggsae]